MKRQESSYEPQRCSLIPPERRLRVFGAILFCAASLAALHFVSSL